jgi:hypothetical protein
MKKQLVLIFFIFIFILFIMMIFFMHYRHCIDFLGDIVEMLVIMRIKPWCIETLKIALVSEIILKEYQSKK